MPPATRRKTSTFTETETTDTTGEITVQTISMTINEPYEKLVQSTSRVTTRSCAKIIHSSNTQNTQSDIKADIHQEIINTFPKNLKNSPCCSSEKNTISTKNSVTSEITEILSSKSSQSPKDISNDKEKPISEIITKPSSKVSVEDSTGEEKCIKSAETEEKVTDLLTYYYNRRSEFISSLKKCLVNVKWKHLVKNLNDFVLTDETVKNSVNHHFLESPETVETLKYISENKEKCNFIMRLCEYVIIKLWSDDVEDISKLLFKFESSLQNSSPVKDAITFFEIISECVKKSERLLKRQMDLYFKMINERDHLRQKISNLERDITKTKIQLLENSILMSFEDAKHLIQSKRDRLKNEEKTEEEKIRILEKTNDIAQTKQGSYKKQKCDFGMSNLCHLCEEYLKNEIDLSKCGLRTMISLKLQKKNTQKKLKIMKMRYQAAYAETKSLQAEVRELRNKIRREKQLYGKHSERIHSLNYRFSLRAEVYEFQKNVHKTLDYNKNMKDEDTEESRIDSISSDSGMETD